MLVFREEGLESIYKRGCRAGGGREGVIGQILLQGAKTFSTFCTIRSQLLSLLYFPPITLDCCQFLLLWEIAVPILSLPTSYRLPISNTTRFPSHIAVVYFIVNSLTINEDFIPGFQKFI